MQHLDLVLATHSGKIVAFTHGSDAVPRPALAAAVGGMAAASGAGKGASGGDASAAIRALREEIEKLQERVLKERDKYAALSTSQVAVTTQFKVKSGQRLLPEEACYLLSVEISMPIDVVAIQSSVPVMLLDVPSNVAVVSRSPQDGKNGNEVLATYRCQDNVQRLEIKARTVEGQHGSVAAYVVPKIAPKTCQRIVFQIKPLSLHEKGRVAALANARVLVRADLLRPRAPVAQEAIQDAIRTRPLNTLTLTGDFSMPEIHAWLCNCVPDLNPRVTSDDADIFLRSSFLGTVLTGSYRKGHAVFRSDSVTTLLIVKEVLAKEASAKKVVVNPQVEVREESVFSVLEGLRPRLDHHFSLARRRELVAPLKELQAHEEDISFLTPEYQDILKHADDVEREFKEAPRHLDFLRGIVHDLLVDLHKLQGKPVQQKVGALFQVLQNYRYEDLIAVFRQRD
jgi:Bardet-Biedl syndrome 7 protein